MRINDLFPIVSKDTTISESDKATIYKLVRIILKNRKDWDLTNDVSALYESLEELASELPKGGDELLTKVFEIEQVVEYLKAKGVYDESEEEDEDDDSDVLQQHITDVRIKVDGSWMFSYLVVINTATFGIATFLLYKSYGL